MARARRQTRVRHTRVNESRIALYVLAVIAALVGAWFALFPTSIPGPRGLHWDCGVPVLAVFARDTPATCERTVRQRSIVGGVLIVGAYGFFSMAESRKGQ